MAEQCQQFAPFPIPWSLNITLRCATVAVCEDAKYLRTRLRADDERLLDLVGLRCPPQQPKNRFAFE